MFRLHLKWIKKTGLHSLFFSALVICLFTLVGCSAGGGDVDALTISGPCKKTCKDSLFSSFDTDDKVMRARLGAIRCMFLYDYFFVRSSGRSNQTGRDSLTAQTIKSRNYLRWERQRHCQREMVHFLASSSFRPISACRVICRGARSIKAMQPSE